jgi:hypothetical protein
MFMWRWHSPWFDTTGLFWGEVRSKTGKQRWFQRSVAVLPSLRPRGRRARAFSGSEETTRDQAPAPKNRNGKTAS